MKSDHFFVLLALLAGLVVPVRAWSAAESVEHRFGVYYNDKRVGEHTYQVVRGEDATRVSSRAAFQVKVLFVTVYRYEHQANEFWQEGCLSDLASETNDNGERFEVDASRQEAGLTVIRRAPERAEQTVDSDCPATFAYWDRERLGRPALINAQTGEALPSSLARVGPESVDGEPAVRYRLEADGLSPIDLWYRTSDDAWIRLQTVRGDGTLVYRLDELSRQPVSGVEQHAGVQDPPGV